jgi:putative addiction module component (TIGR02574 family)
MPISDLDFASLSIEERLRLIEALWESIEQSAAQGDADAARAVEQWADWADIDPDFLAELEREADELEKDPSKGIPWDVLLAELKQKRG